ncbi:BQ2448_7125 [Microbotryum intermedium]|uniref:BQ2448_7125 protein n=1 Tax=Microbotryum intermedium TaxID=269621 RepID=A0A238FHA5_9BASI|nr:BQ2448_7125 [Microbotryum intermedium]
MTYSHDTPVTAGHQNLIKLYHPPGAHHFAQKTTKRKAKQLTPLTRAVVPKLESLSRPAPTFRRVLGAAGRSDASTSRALKSESGEWAAAHRHASPISSRARLFHSNALTDRAQSCSHAESTTQGFQIPISGRIPRPPSPTVEWEGEGHGGTLERWSPRKLKSGTFIGFAARATSHLSSTRTAHVLWQHSISHKLIGVEVAHSAEDVVRPSLCLRVLSVLPDDDRRQWPTSSACSATTPRRIGGRKSVLLHCHLSSRPTGAQSKQMLNPKSDAQSGLVLLSVLDSPASVARVGEIVPQSLDLAGQKTSTAATSNTFVPTSTADLLHIQAGSVVWVFHPYHCVEIVAAQSDAKRAHLICSRFLIAI